MFHVKQIPVTQRCKMSSILINMTFVDQGWRSSILSSLCYHCPLDSGAGCCKIKSTLFWGDLGFIAVNHPDLLPGILNKSTARLLPQGISYECIAGKCIFLTETGCCLPMEAKSLMCRTFTCQGLGLDSHPIGSKWIAAMERLSRKERRLNSELSDKVLSLKFEKPADIMEKVEDFIYLYQSAYSVEPLWIKGFLTEKKFQLAITKPELLAWRLY